MSSRNCQEKSFGLGISQVGGDKERAIVSHVHNGGYGCHLGILVNDEIINFNSHSMAVKGAYCKFMDLLKDFFRKTGQHELFFMIKQVTKSSHYKNVSDTKQYFQNQFIAIFFTC